MKTNEITFNDLPRMIEQMYNSINEIKNELSALKANFEPTKPTELLTRTEVSELLKCDLSTVHNWTKRGKIVLYRIGNRAYYKRSEILDALNKE